MKKNNMKKNNIKLLREEFIELVKKKGANYLEIDSWDSEYSSHLPNSTIEGFRFELDGIWFNIEMSKGIEP